MSPSKINRSLGRREFLSAAVALAACSAGDAFGQETQVVPTQGDLPVADGRAPSLISPSNDDLAQLARDGLDRLGMLISQSDRVAIADFGRPSWEARLSLIDMVSGDVKNLLVAHGSGSDPDRTGWLKSFSNEVGSLASSEGAFRTLGFYRGVHGRSLKLAGLDPTNSNTLKRDVVVHSARYVSPAIIRDTGKLGWSEGCFALDQADLPAVLASLGAGRLLIAGRISLAGVATAAPEGASD